MTDSTFVPMDTPMKVSEAVAQTRTEVATAGLNGGGYVMAWTETPFNSADPTDIKLQLFNSDGTENGSAITVNTSTAGYQFSPSVTVLNGGDIVVAWQSVAAGGGTEGVYVQRYNSSGVAQGSEVQVSPNSTNIEESASVIATQDGGYLVTWTELDEAASPDVASLIGQRYDSGGNANGSQTTLVTETANALEFGSIDVVQLTGGNIAVSYTRYDSTTDYTPQLAIVSSTLTAVSGPQTPAQTTDKPLTDPQTQTVALGNGNVLVVWGNSFDTTGANNIGYGEIFGRIYDSTGSAVGGEFEIAGGQDNRRFDLFATEDGNGGALVGFVQEHADEPDKSGIVINIDQAGTILDGQIWLNPTQSEFLSRPSLTLLSNGEVLGVYQDGLGGSNSSLHHWRFANGDDVRFTSGTDNVTLGNGGEQVHAEGGDDTITGGTGNDAIGGGTGQDLLHGGDGNDSLHGGDDNDTVNGDAGDDVIFGGSGDDEITGGIGADYVDGGTGIDEMDGGDNDDILIGGYGADTIYGGEGNDTIHGFRNTFAGLGPDDPDTDVGVTNMLYGDGGNDTIHGGSGDDIIDGGIGNDTMFGDAYFLQTGNDTFIGSLGNDVLNGGGGIDTADYSGMAQGIIAVLDSNPGGSYVGGDIEFDGLTDRQGIYYVENVIGTAYADDLAGDDEDNEFHSGAGDDRLEGAAGADHLDGGDDFDTADYSGSTSGVTVSLATGTGTGGDAEGDTLADIEALRGSAHSDTLTGDGGDNTLEGGDGADFLVGGAGADEMDGGDGVDTVSYEGASLAVRADLRGNAGIGGDSAGDVITNVENLIGGMGGDVLIGDAGSNELTGNQGNDGLYGLFGDDVLFGGIGDDLLNGGAGADEMHGEDGIDRVSYQGGLAAGVTVDLVNGGSGAGSHAVGDTYDSIENVVGSGLNDTIIGDGGANLFNGAWGDDILVGLGGRDVLIGELGSDTFRFLSETDSGAGFANRDQILDFGYGGDDLIDLSAIDAVAGGGDDAFSFIGTSGFSQTAGELRYLQQAGFNVTIVEADLTGNGIADMQIQLSGLITLDQADFIL